MTSANLKRVWLPALAWVITSYWVAHLPARADEACPDTTQNIDTDRPDVTNSSLVIPQGSVQVENGINWTSGHGSYLDGTNTRVRLGVAHCTEVLVDLPDYATSLSGHGLNGFSDIAPGIKRQFEALPTGLTASAVVGVLLPSGSERVSGAGYGPYIQFPWSQELTEDLKIDGMVTTSWFPSQSNALAEQVTLSMEHEVGSDADLFFEYIGDYRTHETFRHTFNFGGSYGISKTQQIDFHIGFGLNVPESFFGIGYSFRFDKLF